MGFDKQSFLLLNRSYYGGQEMVPKEKQSSQKYLKILEEVKKQYEQYLEVSKLYELPTFQQETEPQVRPPSSEKPLTTNTFRVK